MLCIPLGQNLSPMQKRFNSLARTAPGQTSCNSHLRRDVQQKLNVFCSRPFKNFEVSHVNGIGSVFMCCSAWLPRQIGDLRTQTVDEIWNGDAAQDIRRSIHDGSFEYCSRIYCPYLMSRSGPVTELRDVEDPELVDAIARKLLVLPHGPRELSFSYDRSCNLSCPSCRNDVIVEIAGKKQLLSVENTLRSQALGGAHHVSISGSGDPFGSPSFRKLLQTMKSEEMPNLKAIHLQTNAQLWTPSIWQTIPAEIRAYIKTTEISIDAASSDIYALNRRGGSFERLLENLQFITTLRQSGPLEWMTLKMVVQANNFREMPAFVRLGRQYAADRVLFAHLANWGTYTKEEFASRAVHLPGHPQHSDFTALQHDKMFRDPIIRMRFAATDSDDTRPERPP
jgi:hypothetical protein